jgi:hypothetical protein
MTILKTSIIAVLKSMLLTVLTKKMIEYTLFASARAMVASSKTTKDDEWFKRFEEQYEESN